VTKATPVALALEFVLFPSVPMIVASLTFLLSLGDDRRATSNVDKKAWYFLLFFVLCLAD
jgi:hypothetical protein